MAEKDPYLYPHTDVLKNLADIRDNEELACMEAEYTSLRITDIITENSPDLFDFQALCNMHRYMFMDIYQWAGEPRIMDIEKEEPALGGISIEYSDHAAEILGEMNEFPWEQKDIETVSHMFSLYLAALWKVHPFREGNTRTIVTFCNQFIESKGYYINSELFQKNPEYLRTSLVAASAVFKDLGDKRNTDFLEKIILDALLQGREMKERVAETIKAAGQNPTEETIRKVIQWNRLEHREHNSEEILKFL